MSRFLLRLGPVLLVLLLLTACDGDRYTEGYGDGHRNGFTEGEQKGIEKGKQQGIQEGKEEAWRAIYPGTRHHYSSEVALTQRFLASLGAIKIILALFFFCEKLIERSKSTTERIAKSLFAITGSVVGLVAVQLAGHELLDAFLLTDSPPDPIVVSIVIVVFAAFAYLAAAVFDWLFYVERLWVEQWCLFITAGLCAIFGHSLLNIFVNSPDINDYLGSNCLVGVFIGGAMYFAVKLGKKAARLRHEEIIRRREELIQENVLDLSRKRRRSA